MIHQESVQAVAAARFSPHFIRPLYDTFGFAQLPNLVRTLFGAQPPSVAPFQFPAVLLQPYDRVVLFFVDAFGWRFFEQYRDRSPFLRRFVDQGLAYKLTSQFPSTTSAHVTAIHSGLPVGQSGVHEWFYYEPQLDAIIAPLLFSFAGDSERETLRRTGVDPATLYPTSTIYHDLGQQGVESFVFQHASYAASPYTQVVTNGARVVPFHTLPEALATLQTLFARQTRPSYYFMYVDSIDTICHLHGPESPQLAAEIEAFLLIMEHLWQPTLVGAKGRSLLLMTADHGQTAIDPATTFYVNQHLPQLASLFKTTAAGQPLVPAGSSRDMFLYIADDRLDEAQALLTHALAGRADVRRTADLAAQGFFGSAPPADVFWQRVGNLVVLPYRGESVWWYEKDRFEQPFRGSHGGLTSDEMETLLLVQPYG